MLTFEALRAKHGDALLLHHGTKAKPRVIVIDGGPPGVYPDALKSRLEQLRKQQKLAEATPLDIDMVMVSHLDEDHIAGVLEMMQKLRDQDGPKPWKIARIWHNTFDDILGNKEASIAAVNGPLSPASFGDVLAPEGSLVLASVGQGRELRKIVEFFHLEDNPPFGGLVQRGHAPVKIGDLTLTVIAPDKDRLEKLQADWDQKIKPILKKEKAHKAEIAAFIDSSVYNLSSIVVLVESGGKRLLLTGDGRGDHTLEGLKSAGLLGQDHTVHVDVLKCPHHGSIRNVEKKYFDTIVADHYVISADGKFDNPDVDTLELISAVRTDDKFTLHLTNPLDKFTKPAIGKAVKKFLDADRAAGRKYKVNVRAADDLSIQIPLIA
jgi:ribonuclease BN (tRNA processing enzyme)